MANLIDFALPCWPDLWKQALEHFLQEHHNNSPHTAKSYKVILKQFYTGVAGNRHPGHVSKSDVLTYLNSACHSHRNNGGEPSGQQFNSRLSALSSWYKFTVGYTVPGPDGRPQPLFSGISPTAGIKRRDVPSNPRGFTIDEVRILFSVVDRSSPLGKRDFALFTWYLYLSRRKAELLRLTRSSLRQVEFEAGRVGWAYEYSQKGHGSQIYTAELPPECLEALSDYLASIERDLETMPGDMPLFVAFERGLPMHLIATSRPLHANTVDQRLKLYLRKSGLPTNHGIHDFRHLSAKIRYLGSRDIFQVMKSLGHSSPVTTRRYVESLTVSSDEGARYITEALQV